jgi:predicted Fe-Mo cluster-binding NifX family protein
MRATDIASCKDILSMVDDDGLRVQALSNFGTRPAQSRVMRVAIPRWQGRVSPVLDSACELVVLDIEAGQEVRREERQLGRTDPLARAQEIAELGADTVICGAISAAMEARLVSAGLRVIGFTCGPLDEVLGAFLNGDLTRQAFVMPGCEEWRRRRGGKAMRSGLGRGSGRGWGGTGGKSTAGPGGQWVCPNCGEKVPHTQGQPCNLVACPKCGAKMARG